MQTLLEGVEEVAEVERGSVKVGECEDCFIFGSTYCVKCNDKDKFYAVEDVMCDGDCDLCLAFDCEENPRCSIEYTADDWDEEGIFIG